MYTNILINQAQRMEDPPENSPLELPKKFTFSRRQLPAVLNPMMSGMLSGKNFTQVS